MKICFIIIFLVSISAYGQHDCLRSVAYRLIEKEMALVSSKDYKLITSHQAYGDMFKAKSYDDILQNIEKLKQQYPKQENLDVLKGLFTRIRNEKGSIAPIGRENIKIRHVKKNNYELIVKLPKKNHKISLKIDPKYSADESKDIQERLVEIMSLSDQRHINKLNKITLLSGDHKYFFEESISASAVANLNIVTKKSKIIFQTPVNQMVNSLYDTSALKTFNHEMGHTVAAKIWGLYPAVPKKYIKAVQLDGNEVGSYAKINLVEDFAETFALYHHYKGAYIQEMFKLPHIDSGTKYYISKNEIPLNIREKFYHRFRIIDELYEGNSSFKKLVNELFLRHKGKLLLGSLAVNIKVIDELIKKLDIKKKNRL